MKRICLLIVTLALAVTAANANSVQVKFTGVGGQSINSEYTAPYFIDINGAGPFSVFCDDFGHTQTIGQSWTAYATNLWSGNLANTRFNNLALYKEAVELMVTNPGDQRNANWVVWSLFYPLTLNATQQAMLTTAQTNAPTFYYDWSRVAIYTPIRNGSEFGKQQEFIRLNTPTPEPGTLFLVGSGIIGLSGVIRRRLINSC